MRQAFTSKATHVKVANLVDCNFKFLVAPGRLLDQAEVKCKPYTNLKCL